MRRLAYGVGVALAISFPAVVLGLIIVALSGSDGELQPALRALVLVIVIVGPAVGGAAVARDDQWRVRSGVVGSIALVVVTAFGLAREMAADTDPNVGLLLPAVFGGATLGWVGGTLRTALPGRTRR